MQIYNKYQRNVSFVTIIFCCESRNVKIYTAAIAEIKKTQ